MATQLLPSDYTELLPISNIGGILPAASATSPVDERSALIAKISQLDPTYIKQMQEIGGPDALNALSMPALQQAAARAEFQKNAEAFGSQKSNFDGMTKQYMFTNPGEYYSAFGTVPVMSLGSSYFGVVDPGKGGGWDTAKGAEGPKYLTPEEGTTYTLYSPKSGETLGTGTGTQGLISLAQQANNMSYDMGRKADWQLVATPASGGEPQLLASNLWNSGLSPLGQIFANVLPIAAAFIPGLGTIGTIAASATAGGIGAAMQDRNPLTGALISGATAGLVNAPILPGGSSISSALGKTLQGVGSSGANAAAQAAAGKGGEIVVTGLSKLAQAGGAALGQGLLGNIGNAVLGSNIPAYQQALNDQYAAMQAQGTLPPVESFDPNQIVVAANKLQIAADAINAGAGIGQLAAMGLTPDQMDVARQYAAQTKDQIVVPAQKPIVPDIAPLVANALTTLPNLPQPSTLGQAATEPTAPEPNAPEPITVTAPTTVPTSISPAILAGLTAAAPVAAITSAGAGTTPTTTTEAKPGLLDQILKYGSLASLAAGTIGDLFGGSGGAGGATTPYTSVLGPAPSFSRGGFQPYTGDYETYATRPEWNFFTPTTTAPTMTAPVATPAAPTTQTYTPLI